MLSRAKFFKFSGKNLKNCNFYLLANPAETAYFSFRDRELSNDVRFDELRRRKVVVHTFLGWSQAGRLRQRSCQSYQSHNFFVLRPILVKLHIRTRLIESFAMTFWTWSCAEEKLHFTPVHTLRQLMHDEALIPPLRRVVEFLARYWQKPVRGLFGGQAKFGDRATYGLGAISVCTHTHTRRLIYTSRTRGILRTFKAFWKVY